MCCFCCSLLFVSFPTLVHILSLNQSLSPNLVLVLVLVLIPQFDFEFASRSLLLVAERQKNQALVSRPRTWCYQSSSEANDQQMVIFRFSLAFIVVRHLSKMVYFRPT